MASRTRNITIDQGADYSQTFSVYESPGSTSVMTMGAGDYANAQIRKSSQYTNSALTFDVDMDDAGEGKITITANNYLTSKVKAGRYLYEIVVTDISPNPDTKIRVQEGIATVTPSVEVGSMYTINSTGHDVRSSYT